MGLDVENSCPSFRALVGNDEHGNTRTQGDLDEAGAQKRLHFETVSEVAVVSLGHHQEVVVGSFAQHQRVLLDGEYAGTPRHQRRKLAGQRQTVETTPSDPEETSVTVTDRVDVFHQTDHRSERAKGRPVVRSDDQAWVGGQDGREVLGRLVDLDVADDRPGQPTHRPMRLSDRQTVLGQKCVDAGAAAHRGARILAAHLAEVTTRGRREGASATIARSTRA